MSEPGREGGRANLATGAGCVSLPAYLPLLSGDCGRDLERALLSYMPRLAQGCVAGPRHPALGLSGGAEAEEGRALPRITLGVLGDLGAGEGGSSPLDRRDVVDLQEKAADFAFAPEHAGMDREERREAALWAARNLRRRDLPLFEVVREAAGNVAAGADPTYGRGEEGFAGVALAGLAPGAEGRRGVEEARRAAGEEALVSVLGLSDPGDLAGLYEAGADLVVSDLHERLAAEGRPWADPGLVARGLAVTERLGLALLNLATATGAALPLSAHATTARVRSLPFVGEDGGR